MTQPPPQEPWTGPTPEGYAPAPPYGSPEQPYGSPVLPYGGGYPPATPQGYGPWNAASQGEPTLDQPHYGIGFVAAVRRALKKYARFDGRASRSEYWWWVLAVNIVVIILVIPAGIIGEVTSTDGGNTPGTAALPLLILIGLVYVAVVVPSLAVLMRRLHDGGFSGWLILLGLIPSLGGLVLLVLALLPSSPAGARFDRSSTPPAQA